MAGKNKVLGYATRHCKIFWGQLVMYGEFNSVLYQEYKKGGKPVVRSSKGVLNEGLDENGLLDVGFAGNPYTWTNKRSGWANSKERIDRAFANQQWVMLFPRAVVKHLPLLASNHAPIVLFTEGEHRGIRRLFKFEEIWTRDNNSLLVVENAWNSLLDGSPA